MCVLRGTYGLVKALAGCLFDTRAPDKIRHTLADLFGQRIFGIACGHPDCNDAERLADDPIHKLLLGRDPAGLREHEHRHRPPPRGVEPNHRDARVRRRCGQ